MNAPSPGDFYVRTWGYDQTNVDFYKVIEVTPSGKSVRLQHWTAQLTHPYDGGPSEHVVPGDEPAKVINRNPDGTVGDPHAVDEPLTLHRLRSDTEWIRINDYDLAHPWDGTPQYRTGANWGH